MPERPGLFSLGFLAINLQFALVTAIAALFFAFSGYLAHLGVAPATAGFIISADSLAALVIQPVIAPLVHPGVSRRWLAGGSLILAAALFMAGQVTSVPLLVTARLLQGAGFICVVSALVTMIVQCIPPDMSGRAFGWVSLIRLVPYAVIPPLFDLMKIAPSSFGKVLALAGVAALVPILALALPQSLTAEQAAAPAPGLSGMLDSLRSPSVIMLLLSSLLLFCGYSAVFFYLKQFGIGRGIANVSLFFTIATVAMILVRLCGGWFFDRYSKIILCVMGLFATAVCYALLPACASGRGLFILAGIAGLGWGVAMPLQAAVMFDISSPRTRGMNQNLLIVMMQAGFFLGPLLGGWMISLSGYTALFASLAALTVAAVLMMAGVGRTVKK
ncbi:MAG TPA: MFS transporter [Geobacteraceae bacterium]|nr:MFS transporter [Geobacteraceae bacterium]